MDVTLGYYFEIFGDFEEGLDSDLFDIISFQQLLLVFEIHLEEIAEEVMLNQILNGLSWVENYTGKEEGDGTLEDAVRVDTLLDAIEGFAVELLPILRGEVLMEILGYIFVHQEPPDNENRLFCLVASPASVGGHIEALLQKSLSQIVLYLEKAMH